jgi:hypothetical protein
MQGAVGSRNVQPRSKQLERTVDQEPQPSKDPPPATHDASFPSVAFGACTSRYWAFLEALLIGLSAYEVLIEGSCHATQPLPVA